MGFGHGNLLRRNAASCVVYHFALNVRGAEVVPSPVSPLLIVDRQPAARRDAHADDTAGRNVVRGEGRRSGWIAGQRGAEACYFARMLRDGDANLLRAAVKLEREARGVGKAHVEG